MITERQKYEKGTLNNLFYKFLSNSGIGQMSRGLSQKKTFDHISNSTVVIAGGRLTNPLVAGWVTAFIRTVISEIMNDIHNKGGLVVSCTTDGFITDLPDLENVNSGEFSVIYRKARFNLNPENDCVLELKNTELQELLSWKTRGQMGYTSKINAFTGYQDSKPFRERIELMNNAFDGDKMIKFIQFSLRGATDILKSGEGSVTPFYQEMYFSLVYDNRREVISVPGTAFLRTKPHKNVEDCLLFRQISNNCRRTYNSSLPSVPSGNIQRKDNYEQILLKLLVRAFYHHPELFGLDLEPGLKINRSFIKSRLIDIYEPFKSVSLKYISNQKSKPFIPKGVPEVEKTRFILERIKTLYPSFDQDMFLRP